MNSSRDHYVHSGRAEAMQMRHELIEAGARRCDAAPAQLVNGILTPSVAVHLSSETQLRRLLDATEAAAPERARVVRRRPYKRHLVADAGRQ